MVKYAVEHGGVDHLVAEDVTPLRDGVVGGEARLARFALAPADELEEQVRGLLLRGPVPSSSIAFRVKGQSVRELSFLLGCRERGAGDEPRGWPASTVVGPTDRGRRDALHRARDAEAHDGDPEADLHEAILPADRGSVLSPC